MVVDGRSAGVMCQPWLLQGCAGTARIELSAEVEGKRLERRDGSFNCGGAIEAAEVGVEAVAVAAAAAPPSSISSSAAGAAVRSATDCMLVREITAAVADA